MKRPGLNKFLLDLSNYYEIVVFGTEDSSVSNLYSQFVENITSQLDPHNMIIEHKLGKEATAFDFDGHIKDLRLLNRDLKNVILVDYDLKNAKYTPNNVVILPEFSGDVNDKELLYCIQFLKDMAKTNVKDVRNELTKYGNFKPYLNYYLSIPKYKKLLPKEYEQLVK